MQLDLVVVSGPEQGAVFPVTQSPFVIGRSPAANLHWPSSQVSNRHCILVLQPDGALIRDLGSTNGTFLNGERLKTPASLHHGDCLQIGPLTLEVRIET